MAPGLDETAARPRVLPLALVDPANQTGRLGGAPLLFLQVLKDLQRALAVYRVLAPLGSTVVGDGELLADRDLPLEELRQLVVHLDHARPVAERPIAEHQARQDADVRCPRA